MTNVKTCAPKQFWRSICLLITAFCSTFALALSSPPHGRGLVPTSAMPINDNNAHVVPTLFDIDGAATILSVSDRTVRRLLAGGVLGYCRVGHQIRITEMDLLSYIEHQRVPAGTS
jgi:excisionase family DNA binding protein